jgi:hypothetical protein
LRGIYNVSFNNIRKDREGKSLIYELWAFCYKCLKEEIWVKRCKQVIELETSKGIKRKDKRKKVGASDLEREDIRELYSKKSKKLKTEENSKNLTKNKVQKILK